MAFKRVRSVVDLRLNAFSPHLMMTSKNDIGSTAINYINMSFIYAAKGRIITLSHPRVSPTATMWPIFGVPNPLNRAVL